MRRSPTPFESLRADREVMEELNEEARSRRKLAFESEAEVGRKAIIAVLENPPSILSPGDPADLQSEAIVLANGRPTLLIRNGTFEEPRLQTWKNRLAAGRAALEAVIPAVGRVEVLRHPDYEWLGTAWVVGERLIVTNRHVAELFARGRGGEFAFIKNPFGETVGAQVDFREEHQIPQVFEVNVEKVLYIAAAGQPDVALMLLTEHGELPEPLKLAARDPARQTPVAVIGYPAHDTRNSATLMTRIFADIFDVKRLAPGFVSFTENGPVFEHDCSTLGGNSGSPVVHLETGEAVGLHFAGRFGVANFAVKASTLRQLVAGMRTSVAGGAVPLSDERRTRPEDYDDREGYEEQFLGRESKYRVPLPQLSSELLDDAVRVHSGRAYRGLSAYVLDYTHFSVVMCRSRRLAYYTAVNIDGNSEVHFNRQNTQWIFDPRIPLECQAGNELYHTNKLDRGHLVRRLDPCWGGSAVSRLADEDTFHFTNSCPQHANLNQRTWLSLEDWLLNNTNNRGLKISVFTGPVFRETDIEYRGVQIPEEFWKVVAMVAPNGDLHATAYLLSQRQMLDDIEFVFGKFRTYQTTIRNIEELTGLDFGRLREADPQETLEGAFESAAFVHVAQAADLRL